MFGFANCGKFQQIYSWKLNDRDVAQNFFAAIYDGKRKVHPTFRRKSQHYSQSSTWNDCLIFRHFPRDFKPN